MTTQAETLAKITEVLDIHSEAISDLAMAVKALAVEIKQLKRALREQPLTEL